MLNDGTTSISIKDSSFQSIISKIDKDLSNKNYNLLVSLSSRPSSGYNLELSKSKMGLNFNRGSSIKYYSSDRICSLIANGLLTFLQKGYSYEDFFDDNEHVIYFSNHDDLKEKIQFFSNNFEHRSKIAEKGKNRYFELFDHKLVTKYMINKIFNIQMTEKKLWMN